MADLVNVSKASDPQRPTTYRRGDLADAESAVPDRRVAVDWIFSRALSRI